KFQQAWSRDEAGNELATEIESEDHQAQRRN
ncbi:hypothetical protein L914_12273, partial [Phytophthora nicotianae]